MSEVLPWWVSCGGVLGWVLVALGGACGALLTAALGRRRARRAAARRRDALGSARAEADPSGLGETVTLEGVLRTPSGGRLERPADGAPLGVLAILRGPAHDPAFVAAQPHVITHRVSTLELELRDGTRVELADEVELTVGSSETLAARPWDSLKGAARERLAPLLDGPPAPGRVYGFRALTAGDRVMARGRLDRRPKAEDGGYRAPSATLRLGATADEEPVRLAAVDGARLLWPSRGRLVTVALTASLVSFGALALAADQTQEQRDPARRLRTADLEGRQSEYRAPFGTPPAAFVPGLLSPLHREAALRDLGRRYQDVAPQTDETGRAAVEVAALVGCGESMALWSRLGRHEKILSADPCGSRHAMSAALQVGDVARAASEGTADVGALVAQQRWSEAASELSTREEQLAETARATTAEAGREWLRERLALTTCLRRSFVHRAGGELQPSDAELEEPRCRAAWVDALPRPEGRAVLTQQAPPSGDDDAEVLRLLWVEAGLPLELDEPQERIPSIFVPWAWAHGASPYSGLHAAARRAWERTEGRSALVGAGLYARAAMFEAFSGDLGRARGFATRALALAPRDALAHVWEAPASVLVYEAWLRGDVARARQVIDAIPPLARYPLAYWVDAFEGRHDALEGSWSSRSSLRAALSGDGARLAFLTALKPHRLAETALLAPLVTDGRDALAAQARWTPRYDRLGSGLEPRRRLRTWSAERALARAVGDEAAERRAARRVARFRRLVMERDTAVPMLLLEEI